MWKFFQRQKAVKSYNKLNNLIENLADTPAEIARPSYNHMNTLSKMLKQKEAIFKIIKYTNGNLKRKDCFFETKKFMTSME